MGVVTYILNLRDNLTPGIESATRSTNNLEASLGSVNNTASKLGSAFGIAFGVAGVVAFGKKVIEAGTMVENATTGLTTLLKDSGAAAKVVADTMQDATEMPFAFEGLLNANKALISAGVGADRARIDVKNLANAIAATGGGDDELNRMVVNMQQISNTGKATAQDIKQFAFAGINIYKVLADATGKTTEETKGMEVTYDLLTMALEKAHAAGGIYANGLENMAGNTSVQISNLGDSIFNLSNQIFVDLKPAITAIIEAVSGFIKHLSTAWGWAYKNKDILIALGKGILVAVAIMKTMAIIPPILLAIENAMVAAATGGVTFGASMAAALGPIGLIAIAIGGLVMLFSKLGANIEAARVANLAFIDKSREQEVSMLKEVAAARGGGQKGIDSISEEEKTRLKATIADLNQKYQGAVNDNDTERKKQLNLELSEANARYNEVDKFQQGLLPDQKASTVKTLAKPGATGAKGVDAKSKATGSKSVTINVQIKDLIGVQNINTTNLREGAGKIKDQIVSALTGAVNDFQVVAGQ